MTILLSVTLAFAAGLLAGFRLTPSPSLLAALPLAAAALFALRRRNAVILAFTVLGIALGALRAAAAAVDCRAQIPDGATVRMVAVMLVVPTEGVTLPVRASTLTAGRVSCSDVDVRVRIAPRHIAAFDSAVSKGSALQIRGRWMAYSKRSGWPRKPEHAGGVLVDAVSLDADAPGADAATRLRASQQRALRAMLPERWGIAESLLLAENAGITPEIRMRWVSSGLVHLLAISGMHVGLIAAGTLFLCAITGVPPRTGRRAALLVSATYVLFLGAPSAALRSLLQACLLLASLELQRPAEPFTALAAAALVILLIEPLALIDVGFQLSFAGMVGLVAWRRTLMDAMPDRVHRYVRDGLASGIAATALTTPVAALHFGTASWIGIPATLIAAPLFAAALALLVLSLVIAAVTGATAGVHAWLTDAVLRVLDRIAEIAASVPGGHGYVAWTTVLYVLGAVACAILIVAARRGGGEAPPSMRASQAVHDRYARRHRRRALQVVTASAAALALVAWAPLVLHSRDDLVEIHAIDVGQGDAFAIRTPGGRWLLVDTGPRTARGDAGRDRVIPYLLRRGARRIDALILTHPDADHIGGAEAVLEAFEVDVVIDPGLAAGKDLFIDLLGTARSAGQRWIAAREGMRFNVDGVDVQLLYPAVQLDGSRDANDNSVVFRLSFGTFAALFTGDAPASVEDELVARYGKAIGAALLKVGHHGSATSTGDALLDAADPQIAVISAGRRNRYGHPNPGVLERLERHRVRVLRTDQSGSLTLRASRNGAIEVLAH